MYAHNADLTRQAASKIYLSEYAEASGEFSENGPVSNSQWGSSASGVKFLFWLTQKQISVVS